MLSRNHMHVRTVYDLIHLDLESVNRSDVRHIFIAHLERVVRRRLESDPAPVAGYSDGNGGN